MARCTNVPNPLTGKACSHPTSRAAKKGLSAFVCRRCQAHRQRHGSFWCPSPPAATLRPYLAASLSYVRSHRTDPFIAAALHGLESLLENAGPVEAATRLRGLSPAVRAKVALARLREASIKPERLLAIVLAVSALMGADPSSVHVTREWRLVATAKATHRLASGTHRRWEAKDHNGKTIKLATLHAYPRSSGQVLRHLGEHLAKECELVLDHHLAAVVASLAVTRQTSPTSFEHG